MDSSGIAEPTSVPASKIVKLYSRRRNLITMRPLDEKRGISHDGVKGEPRKGADREREPRSSLASSLSRKSQSVYKCSYTRFYCLL